MKTAETKVRIKQAYEYLRNNGLAHTQQDIADKMGASKSTVSGAFNGNEKCLTERFVVRFNEAYGNTFSLEWLMGEPGNMLGSSSAEQVTQFITQSNNNNAQVVGKADDAIVALKDEKIKMLEDQVKFLKEQVEFYKSQK